MLSAMEFARTLALAMAHAELLVSAVRNAMQDNYSCQFFDNELDDVIEVCYALKK